MKALIYTLLLACATASAQLPAPGTPGAPNDPRYTGEPIRNADGKIRRNPEVVREFKKTFPCPETGLHGACENWQVDHVLPLACGGADRQDNLQWLPSAIKSAPGTLPKDRWERKVYCQPTQKIVLP